MHTQIPDVCVRKYAWLGEAISVEELHDPPTGLKQAVEDFIDARNVEIAISLVISPVRTKNRTGLASPSYRLQSPDDRAQSRQ